MDVTLGNTTRVGNQDEEVTEMLNQTADEIGVERIKDLEDTAGLPVPLATGTVEVQEDEEVLEA